MVPLNLFVWFAPERLEFARSYLALIKAAHGLVRCQHELTDLEVVVAVAAALPLLPLPLCLLNSRAEIFLYPLKELVEQDALVLCLGTPVHFHRIFVHQALRLIWWHVHQL